MESLDLIVKRNQAFIVTHFSKSREQFCDHLLGEGQTEKSTGTVKRSSSLERRKSKSMMLGRLNLLIKVSVSTIVIKCIVNFVDIL